MSILIMIPSLQRNLQILLMHDFYVCDCYLYWFDLMSLYFPVFHCLLINQIFLLVYQNADVTLSNVLLMV